MRHAFIDGRAFKALFIAGALRLDESKDYLNSINVFPVPDADTGSNMAGTMNTAVDALHAIDDHSLANVLETIAYQLRMEAKGNSGIILSEFFHGMFQEVKDIDRIEPHNFIKALASGKEAAYSALAEPKEGTILTLISRTVEKLRKSEGELGDMSKAIELLVETQRIALKQTPELMPLLKKNHVVDSGAHGFLLFWEGALSFIKNEIDHVILQPIKKVFKRDKTDEIKFRYCTEALVRGAGFDKKTIKQYLITRGDSLIITGDGDLLKVHIHTNEPEETLEYLGQFGEMVKRKVDDMKSQSQQAARSEERQAIRIVVDSCCDLDLVLREENDIEMTPLQLIFGDDSYRDRIDMTADEFYEKLKSSDVIPKTSLPKGSDFIKAYEHIDPYCDEILAIYISSGLSGTYQAGKKWGNNFNKEKVTVYDSGMASLATGFLALEAARMAKAGEPMKKIITRLGEIKSKVSTYIVVKTLKYLARTGRIGKAQRFMGEALGIKPILTLAEGQVSPKAKGFGSENAINKALGFLEKDSRAPGFEGVFGVVYSDNRAEGEKLASRIRERFNVKELVTGQISPVIGVHGGPGTLAIFCY